MKKAESKLIKHEEIKHQFNELFILLRDKRKQLEELNTKCIYKQKKLKELDEKCKKKKSELNNLTKESQKTNTNKIMPKKVSEYLTNCTKAPLYQTQKCPNSKYKKMEQKYCI